MNKPNHKIIKRVNRAVGQHKARLTRQRQTSDALIEQRNRRARQMKLSR